jgi:hypothetical protein
MGSQSIVDEVKKLCFSRGASIGGDPHREFITNLEHLLRTRNYRVEKEYRLLYNHRTLKTGKVQRVHGDVDLFAEGWNHKIAIEYDGLISLRYKTIEKLLQSNADILIGIVGNGTLNDNKERILKVMDDLRIKNRKLLLIAVSEKASEEVCWQDH